MAISKKSKQERIIYPQLEVFGLFGFSQSSGWRHVQKGTFPGPDIQIQGRKYYSAQKRQEAIDAILSHKTE